MRVNLRQVGFCPITFFIALLLEVTSGNNIYYFYTILGSPEAAEFEIEHTDDPLMFELRWSKPKENGAPITSYTIYRRLVGENGQKDQWDKIKTLSVDLPLSYNVTLDWGKHYEFVVTATNSFGEATKEDNRIKDVQVDKGTAVHCTTIFEKQSQPRKKFAFQHCSPSLSIC